VMQQGPPWPWPLPTGQYSIVAACVSAATAPIAVVREAGECIAPAGW
jgi:hypothetical protein